MGSIFIDGVEYTADPERDLLSVCLGLGIDLPYFCWHPALGSVGACRQCAVKQFKDADDTRGKLVMACMTPAADGTRIGIADQEAAALRRGVIEWLMTNHPHDCPVCEEGGECHLQDMTLMSGHVYRRHRFPKRTFRNQDLGPCIGHEMNRCITCYRCVRFYRDHAGGEDLRAMGIGDAVYFGRQTDGTLESPFSGNLVEVCPTGVFTDKPFARRYLRKWDLMTAPSVCVHCAVGCNIQPAVRAGEYDGPLRRVMNRYNDAVNGDFICDRGRFGGDFVNAVDRPRRVQRHGGAGPGRATADDALADLADRLRAGRVLGIGSPRASLEANFLLRQLVGVERFVAGCAAPEHELSAKALRFQEILDRYASGSRVVEFRQSARTAQQAAEAIGCELDQIVKSLVFRAADDSALLVLTAGGNRVDEKTIGATLGGAVRMGDAVFVRAQTGYAIGGVPPFGHPRPLQTLIDEDLLAFDEIWAAGGTPNTVFPIQPARLLEITGARQTRVV